MEADNESMPGHSSFNKQHLQNKSPSFLKTLTGHYIRLMGPRYFSLKNSETIFFGFYFSIF